MYTLYSLHSTLYSLYSLPGSKTAARNKFFLRAGRQPASVGGGVVMAAAPGAAEEVDEKTEFNVMLDEVPADKKIAVLKVVRTLTGLGLKEAKELVESAPKMVQEALSKDAAEDAKKQIEEAGGKVSLT